MVARVMILLLICEAKKVWWMLEQPTSSLMELHPCFQQLMALPSVQIRRLSTCMVYFGSATRKPTWLYSSHSVYLKRFQAFLRPQ